MQFKFEAVKGVGVISMGGRLDASCAGELKSFVDRRLADGNPTMVLDLEGVTFMDSAGLGAVIGALKAARLAGGNLRIAQPGDQVRYILAVTTLDRVLVPYRTVDEALQA